MGNDNDSTIERLGRIYGTEETVYVTTMKLVTIAQAACENEQDNMLRVGN